MDNLGAVIGPLTGGRAAHGGRRPAQCVPARGDSGVARARARIRGARARSAGARDATSRFAGRSRDSRRRFGAISCVLALFTLGNSSNMFLLLRANELGASATRVTLMWALFSRVAAILSTPLSALSDRFGRARVLGIAWFAYAAAYLMIGLLPSADWALWLAFRRLRRRHRGARRHRESTRRRSRPARTQRHRVRLVQPRGRHPAPAGFADVRLDLVDALAAGCLRVRRRMRIRGRAAAARLGRAGRVGILRPRRARASRDRCPQRPRGVPSAHRLGR